MSQKSFILIRERERRLSRAERRSLLFNMSYIENEPLIGENIKNSDENSIQVITDNNGNVLP